MNNIVSYGINMQNRSMYPCSKERAQTVAVCHRVGVVIYGLKYLASEKSRMPYSKDVSQALSTCPDSSVVMVGKRDKVFAFTQNTREEVRDLCNVSGCISAESGSHQTTYVATKKGI